METMPSDKKHRIFPEIFREFLNFRSQYSLILVCECEHVTFGHILRK